MSVKSVTNNTDTILMAIVVTVRGIEVLKVEVAIVTVIVIITLATDPFYFHIWSIYFMYSAYSFMINVFLIWDV